MILINIVRVLILNGQCYKTTIYMISIPFDKNSCNLKIIYLDETNRRLRNLRIFFSQLIFDCDL